MRQDNGLVKLYGLMFTLERLNDGSVLIKKYDYGHGRWEPVKKVRDWDVAEMMVREWWVGSCEVLRLHN